MDFGERQEQQRRNRRLGQLIFFAVAVCSVAVVIVTTILLARVMQVRRAACISIPTAVAVAGLLPKFLRTRLHFEGHAASLRSLKTNMPGDDSLELPGDLEDDVFQKSIICSCGRVVAIPPSRMAGAVVCHCGRSLAAID